MNAVFLGTGAAEGCPSTYCRCSVCQAARKNGGKDIRTRSALRLGEHHQIDVPPDTAWQMMMHGLDMFTVDHILLTHTHGDHLSLPALTDRTMAARTSGKPITVYLSEPARVFLEQIAAATGLSAALEDSVKDRVQLVPVEMFDRYRIGAIEVQTLVATHGGCGPDERTVNYFITTPDGRHTLYAVDTGYYPESTWDYLEGLHADTVIMDCTFGGRKDRDLKPSEHLDVQSFVGVIDRMAAIGFVNKATSIYATHINPHQGLTHTGMEAAFVESGAKVNVAFDGLRIDL